MKKNINMRKMKWFVIGVAMSAFGSFMGVSVTKDIAGISG